MERVNVKRVVWTYSVCEVDLVIGGCMENKEVQIWNKNERGNEPCDKWLVETNDKIQDEFKV